MEADREKPRSEALVESDRDTRHMHCGGYHVESDNSLQGEREAEKGKRQSEERFRPIGRRSLGDSQALSFREKFNLLYGKL